MTPYSNQKANLHLKKLLDLQNNIQPYPVHVQIIISDYCNQDCSFCCYRTSGYSSNELFKILNNDGSVDNNPKRMIPFAKVEEIIDDCSEMEVKAIQITGGGEPTVHPQFNQICQKILDKGIDLAVVTNGLLLNEKRANLLKDACWVRISVDAGSADTYSSVRRVPKAEYKIVENNIRRICAIPNRKVLVGVGFVVTKENYKELYSACKNFKEWGADNVRISAMFSNEEEHYYKDIYDAISAQLLKVKALNDDKFKVFNNFQDRIEDLQQQSPNYSFCGHMNFTTYIGGDQEVYTCCVNAYNTRGKIGSIKNARFKDVWDSEQKKNMFTSFDAKDCSRCMFNEKNRNIIDSLKLPVAHDNFV